MIVRHDHRPTVSPLRGLAARLVSMAALCAMITTGCTEPEPGLVDAVIGDTLFPPGDTTKGDTPEDTQVADGDTSPPGDTTDTASGCDSCAAPTVCLNGACVSPAACTISEIAGCYDETRELACTDLGDGQTGWAPQDCDLGEKCLLGSCAAIVCEPGKSYCDGLNAKKTCLADGTGFETVEACPDQQFCSSGQCGSSCALDPKFGSHVGCSFWTVDLPQYPDPFGDPENEPHYVVVSNPGELDAEVTFEAPGGWTVNVVDNVVPGHSSVAFEMPVVNVQKSGVMNAGIKMDSTRPVLVHQFNPFNNSAVFSNDASLLLPETVLGHDYVIMTWPSGLSIPGFIDEPQSGYFSVLAVTDDTTVTVTVNGQVDANGVVPAMAIGDVQLFTLQRGEVLNIEANVTLADLFTIDEKADLTGSLVSSDKPVAVFGGHEEAVVGVPDEFNGNPGEEGSGSCCAEHLEEQLLPIPTLGVTYLCGKSASRGGEPDVWRIQAAADNVVVTTNPPQPGAHNVTLAKKGDWIQVFSTDSFVVTGSNKLQVGQFLVSQEVTEQGTGDPAFILAVPVERFRKSYIVNVPTGYANDFVAIMRPAGAPVSYTVGPVDNSLFTAFGGGSWEIAHVPLTPGVYTFASDQPFGLYAYGYDNAVSYGYPGGMDISAAE